MKQLTFNSCQANLFFLLPQWNRILVHTSWLPIALILSFGNVNLNAQCTLSLTCPANQTVNTDADACEATLNFADPVITSSDPVVCNPVWTQTDGPSNGSTEDLGVYTLSFEATDDDGNTETCSFTISVQDNLAPVMTCPDVTINLNPGFCGGIVSYEVTAEDNCGIDTNELESGPASGDYLDYHDSPWSTEWKAVDVNGNTTTCSFTIEMFEYANPTEVLTCNDNVQISIDDAGAGIVGADMILEGVLYSCYDDYIVTINGGSNVLSCDMVGEDNLIAMVEDPDTGNTCWGSIVVEDKIGPSCASVSDQTVNCIEGLPSSTDPTYYPSFEDNCEVAIVNLISETVLDNDICDDIEVQRVWSAIDGSGNASLGNCTQVITISRVTPQLPANDAYSCAEYDLEDLVPALTGEPIGAISACNYSFTYSDAVLAGCGPSQVITRTWTILDMCNTNANNAVSTHIQIIELSDNVPPSISGSDITLNPNVAADNQQACTSTEFIPIPEVTDNCSAITSLQVFTPVGELDYVTDGAGNIIGGNIPAPGLEIGTHEMTVTAEDECGNVSEEIYDISVVDGFTPNVICTEFLTVSLSTDGTAVVTAESFDNGTYDNCCLDYFEVRRMDEDVFGPTVSFDCDDETITVVFRAVDCSNNSSECMAEITVDDKLSPVVACPPDASISCDVYYTDYAPSLDAVDWSVLEDFGVATIVDNCSFTDTYDMIYDIDQCGVGEITREWTATDAAANDTISCTQIISVFHVSDWNVSFPADFEGEVDSDCNYEDIEFGLVTISNDGCEMVSYNHIDTQFGAQGQDACFKIFREYTVINWCNYDDGAANELSATLPDVNYNVTGDDYITYTQTINVKDTLAPVLDVSPMSTSVSATSCFATFGQLAVDSITIVDGCSTDVYTTTINYGALTTYLNTSTAQFEEVPAGEYTVTFSVSDPCGNVGTAIKTVVVEEKAPTAFCEDELVIGLMASGMQTVTAEDFNLGSLDNCTPASELTFAFSSDITNTEMTVTCDNVGPNDITMYVFDEAGLTSFCSVTLDVQDNLNACGGSNPTLAGAINTGLAAAVEGVTVEVNGGLFATTTGADGMFSFELVQGGDYTVAPSLNVDVANGVTTFDIVKITQHILGIQSLDSAYKVIAADVNNSQSLSTLDIVMIRKVILQVSESFPNNTSWRFVDADYVFADPMNPWGFAEVVNFNNLDTDVLTSDFVAVKVGDVNGSASPALGAVQNRTMKGVFSINAADIAITAGQTYEVAFTADAAVEGFQFTLNFDTEKVAFAGMKDGVATEQNFGLVKLNKGAITASWNAEQAYDFAGEEVFTISFTALADANLSDVLSINSRFTAAEAYAGADLQDVELTFSGSAANNYALYQNTPNPFKGETNIAFELAQAGEAVISIMDVNGKVVRVIEGDFAAGFNNVRVNNIEATGVLYYTLESGDFTATKKMIIIE